MLVKSLSFLAGADAGGRPVSAIPGAFTFDSAMSDVGFSCAFLATPYARRVSGETMYVDGSVHIMA
jgi:enoyl-[acyl-carrier-protein] reductase (NADH)